MELAQKTETDHNELKSKIEEEKMKMKTSFGIKGKMKRGGSRSHHASKMSVAENDNGDIRSPSSNMENSFARIDEKEEESMSKK